MPFFSIIIPTFNSERDIYRCCISIVNQTFQDYEIIVQDALSTDMTLAILLQIKQSNPNVRIHVYSEKDSGIYDAMNKGIEKATGEWIYFLGGDDTIYDEQVFKQIFDVCSKNDQDVIYGNVLSKFLSKRPDGVYGGEFNKEKLLKYNICHQSIFMKKTVFSRIGVFNVKYKGHADWEHNIRWFLSDNISKNYVDIVIANYSDGGFSSSYRDSIFENEKVLTFLILGRKKLKLKVKLTMLKSLAGYALHVKNYRLIGKMIIYSPLILL